MIFKYISKVKTYYLSTDLKKKKKQQKIQTLRLALGRTSFCYNKNCKTEGLGHCKTISSIFITTSTLFCNSLVISLNMLLYPYSILTKGPEEELFFRAATKFHYSNRWSMARIRFCTAHRTKNQKILSLNTFWIICALICFF